MVNFVRNHSSVFVYIAVAALSYAVVIVNNTLFSATVLAALAAYAFYLASLTLKMVREDAEFTSADPEEPHRSDP